ncbi:hypothetical protein C5N13_05875 [Sinorhizobium meliloti]|nr:hypothetical protein C5N13_05875 [Sinorhizobium meliloti]
MPITQGLRGRLAARWGRRIASACRQRRPRAGLSGRAQLTGLSSVRPSRTVPRPSSARAERSARCILGTVHRAGASRREAG